MTKPMNYSGLDALLKSEIPELKSRSQLTALDARHLVLDAFKKAVPLEIDVKIFEDNFLSFALACQVVRATESGDRFLEWLKTNVWAADIMLAMQSQKNQDAANQKP